MRTGNAHVLASEERSIWENAEHTSLCAAERAGHGHFFSILLFLCRTFPSYSSPLGILPITAPRQSWLTCVVNRRFRPFPFVLSMTPMFRPFAWVVFWAVSALSIFPIFWAVSARYRFIQVCCFWWVVLRLMMAFARPQPFGDSRFTVPWFRKFFLQTLFILDF